MVRRHYTSAMISPEELSAKALLKAVKLHPEFEWLAAKIWIDADTVQILFRPETGRTGLAWESASLWGDCSDLRDAIEWYLAISENGTGESEA